MPDNDNASATSSASLSLTAQKAYSRTLTRPPPRPPSREHSTSSSQLFGDVSASFLHGSDRPEVPRLFSLPTPPSETPLEAARTLLEGSPVDPLAFGLAGRAGALFAPDMTPPTCNVRDGHSELPATVASPDTEAMYTPSADTPAMTGQLSARPKGVAAVVETAAEGRKTGPTHARSLSGMFRACVVDTFGLGNSLMVSSVSPHRTSTHIHCVLHGERQTHAYTAVARAHFVNMLLIHQPRLRLSYSSHAQPW